MVDLLELIKSRRNIKFFTPKFVSWEKISRIIDAGRHAPSCGNIQNWKFIVVAEPAAKQAVAESCYDQYDIVNAFCLIVIIMEPDKAERYYGVRGGSLYTPQNCGAVVQNMLLEAHSLGLGSSWIGSFDESELRSLLGVPEEARPQAVIPIGYPREIPDRPPKYPMETVTYFGSWRGRVRDPAKYFNDLSILISRNLNEVKEKIVSTFKK